MVKVSYDVIKQCYSAVFRIRTSLTTYKNYIVMRKGMGQQHLSLKKYGEFDMNAKCSIL